MDRRRSESTSYRDGNIRTTIDPVESSKLLLGPTSWRSHSGTGDGGIVGDFSLVVYMRNEMRCIHTTLTWRRRRMPPRHQPF